MVHGEANDHVEEENKAKRPHEGYVTGEVGRHPSPRPEDKQQSGGGANRALVEHGNVDSLDFLPEFWRLRLVGGGGSHGTTIPQGV